MSDHVVQKWIKTWDEMLTPATTISLVSEKPAGSNQAFHNPVTVVLDGRGSFRNLVVTYYSLNGGQTFEPYGGPFTISKNGDYNLAYYSRYLESPSALVEKPKTETVSIKQVSPVNLKGRLFAWMYPEIEKSDQFYVVKGGDTMTSIAERYGVSLGKLLAANTQITNPSMIYHGELVRIPSGRSESAPPFYAPAKDRFSKLE